MHEMALAQSMLEIIREEMQRHAATVLKSVRVNIGEMSAVVPESLSFCFDVMTEGTDMEGARLIMEVIPLRGYCPGCREEFAIEDYAFVCPTCGSTRIDLMSGQELSIVEIEVD